MHNLSLVYFINLYMFRAYLGPSSWGTTVCIQQLVLIILFRWLSVALVGLESSPIRNILRISCASSCFFFTRLYRDARSTEHKIWLRVLTTKVSELLGCYILLAGLKSPVCCPGWIGFQSNQDNRQSSKKNNKYQLLYTYGCTTWWWA